MTLAGPRIWRVYMRRWAVLLLIRVLGLSLDRATPVGLMRAPGPASTCVPRAPGGTVL